MAGPSGLRPVIKRREIIVSETSSFLVEEPILSDRSSDEIDEEDLVGVRNKTFKPLERDPKVNLYSNHLELKQSLLRIFSISKLNITTIDQVKI